MMTHKDSNVRKESENTGYYRSEYLNESFVPPQIIENSAILFSNTKKRATMLKKEHPQNALQTDFDKSEIAADCSANDNRKSNDSEGEYDGEGESYSSSCSCSS